MEKSLIVKIFHQSLEGLVFQRSSGRDTAYRAYNFGFLAKSGLKFKARSSLSHLTQLIHIQFSNRYNVIQHPVIIPSNNVLSKQEKILCEISAEFLVIYSIL